MNSGESVPNHVKRLRALPLVRAISTSLVGIIQGQPLRLGHRWHFFAGGRAPLILFALFSILLFAIGVGSNPIQRWDESRLAVNAMEMHLHGLSVVTTYEFSPDHWNTKPPLLIWLMTLLMDALGPSEFAIRLPSALGAAGTVCIAVYFCWRVTRSVAWSLFAGALLLGARFFIGAHAALTGDYDALLTFFTTAYLSLLFFLLHREKPKFAKLLLASLFISAALLTKDIAGLVPGAGVTLYLLLVSRWRRVLTVRYLIAGLIGLLPTAVYYLCREQLDPGYLSVVNRNNWLGRYSVLTDTEVQPFYFYFGLLMPQYFIGSVLIPLLPFGWRMAKGRNRLALIYATVVAATILAVYSASASKYPWYTVPALPWLAVAITLSTRAILRRLDSVDVKWERMARMGLLLLAATCLAHGIAFRILHSPRKPMDSQDTYSTLLKALYDRGERTVRILDGGVPNSAGLVGYTPQLHYLALYWGPHGLNVQLLEAETAQPGDLIATCDPNERAAVASIKDAVPLLQDNNCLAVKVASIQ
jgi:4-amino-4-deoxy-L-arabinose transferase-like glycosyltransferase